MMSPIAQTIESDELEWFCNIVIQNVTVGGGQSSFDLVSSYCVNAFSQIYARTKLFCNSMSHIRW